MTHSTIIQTQIITMNGKIQKLKGFVATLKTIELDTSFGVSRDDSKMSGDKYETLDKDSKEIIKTHTKAVKSICSEVQGDLNAKILAHTGTLNELKSDYETAVRQEREERARLAKERERQRKARQKKK